MAGGAGYHRQVVHLPHGEPVEGMGRGVPYLLCR